MHKLEDFRMMRVLGQGSFGKCSLVEERSTRKLYVMKEVNVSSLSKKEVDDAVREANILSRLQHPNICGYVSSFTQKGLLCMIMEYCDKGDLHQLLKNQRGRLLSEQLILDIFAQICLALNYVHGKKILHRDIKAQNIFLSQGNIVKLGDFGVSRVLASTFEMARTAIGTPYYLSPEICSDAPYSYKSDIWSLGCLLYELCTLNHPFDAANMKSLVTKIMRGTYPAIPPTYSADLRKLVDEMLVREPKQRPNVATLLRRPILRPSLEKYIRAGDLAALGDPLPAPAPPSQRPMQLGPTAVPARAANPMYNNPLLAEYANQAQGAAPRRPPSSRPQQAQYGQHQAQHQAQAQAQARAQAQAQAEAQAAAAAAADAARRERAEAERRRIDRERRERAAAEAERRSRDSAAAAAAARKRAVVEAEREREARARAEAERQRAQVRAPPVSLDARAAVARAQAAREDQVNLQRQALLRAREARDAAAAEAKEAAAARAREEIAKSQAAREANRRAMRENISRQRENITESDEFSISIVTAETASRLAAALPEPPAPAPAAPAPAPAPAQPLILDSAEPSPEGSPEAQVQLEAQAPDLGLEEALAAEGNVDDATMRVIQTMVMDIKQILASSDHEDAESSVLEDEPIPSAIPDLSQTTRVAAGNAQFRAPNGGKLELKVARVGVSILARIEALREYLENQMGFERFDRLYQIMDTLSASDDDDTALSAELERIVSPEERGFITLVSQLLVAEDNFNQV